MAGITVLTLRSSGMRQRAIWYKLSSVSEKGTVPIFREEHRTDNFTSKPSIWRQYASPETSVMSTTRYCNTIQKTAILSFQ